MSLDADSVTEAELRKIRDLEQGLVDEDGFAAVTKTKQKMKMSLPVTHID